jgi:hypothetical protein
MDAVVEAAVSGCHGPDSLAAAHARTGVEVGTGQVTGQRRMLGERTEEEADLEVASTYGGRQLRAESVGLGSTFASDA